MTLTGNHKLQSFWFRFGPSRCLIALSNIAKGAEILVDYSYNPKGARVPRWYKRLYAETYPESKNKKKKQ